MLVRRGATPRSGGSSVNWLSACSTARVRSDEPVFLCSGRTLFTSDRSPERSSDHFYLGHLEAFDWNLLREQDPEPEGFPS